MNGYAVFNVTLSWLEVSGAPDPPFRYYSDMRLPAFTSFRGVTPWEFQRSYEQGLTRSYLQRATAAGRVRLCPKSTLATKGRMRPKQSNDSTRKW